MMFVSRDSFRREVARVADERLPCRVAERRLSELESNIDEYARRLREVKLERDSYRECYVEALERLREQEAGA